jgi:hypothetical protein
LVGGFDLSSRKAASRDLKSVLPRGQRPGGRAAAYAWNVLGIVDLANALTLGFLSSPTRFQLLALDAPNRLVGAYPLVMIPAFAVPLALILHGLSIWQLRRSGRSKGRA